MFREILKENKQTAYDLWINCLNFKYSTSSGMAEKRDLIKDLFLREDRLFGLSRADRRKGFYRKGVEFVFEITFKIFEKSFNEYVASTEFERFTGVKTLK